jgi:hypothetical protein
MVAIQFAAMVTSDIKGEREICNRVRIVGHAHSLFNGS